LVHLRLKLILQVTKVSSVFRASQIIEGPAVCASMEKAKPLKPLSLIQHQKHTLPKH